MATTLIFENQMPDCSDLVQCCKCDHCEPGTLPQFYTVEFQNLALCNVESPSNYCDCITALSGIEFELAGTYYDEFPSFIWHCLWGLDGVEIDMSCVGSPSEQDFAGTFTLLVSKSGANTIYSFGMNGDFSGVPFSKGWSLTEAGYPGDCMDGPKVLTGLGGDGCFSFQCKWDDVTILLTPHN